MSYTIHPFCICIPRRNNSSSMKPSGSRGCSSTRAAGSGVPVKSVSPRTKPRSPTLGIFDALVEPAASEMKLRPNCGRPSSPRGSTRIIRMGMRSCVGWAASNGARLSAALLWIAYIVGIISLGTDECRGCWIYSGIYILCKVVRSASRLSLHGHDGEMRSRNDVE